MSIRQIEKLYNKMIQRQDDGSKINTGVRTEIFHRIMDDVERLQKKLKHTRPGSRQHRALDAELRQLMLKEIQVIIDDYIIARQNGTLDRWQKMYGDISYYIRNFYTYREARISKEQGQVVDAYGFLDQDETVYEES